MALKASRKGSHLAADKVREELDKVLRSHHPDPAMEFESERNERLEPTSKRSKGHEDDEQDEGMTEDGGSPAPADPDTTFLQGSPGAGSESLPSDVVSDRRVMGAAATVGGTAGALLMGPVSGVALGAAALYATTREDSAGTVARKAGSMYLKVHDRAVDHGLRAVDQGVKAAGALIEKGCNKLEASSSMPYPVRAGLKSLSGGQAIASKRDAKANAEEAKRIREKYPDRIPIICERSSYSNLPQIPKSKFVVPGTMLCGEFKYIVHKQIMETMASQRVKAEQTIYLFVNGITPKTGTAMSELYTQFREPDGFLYIRYGAENTLG
eukprot:TRINITY_DN16998_c0_g1_i1.p2 TRINITY_DN16998_c0_g1~~TRINITY_DN16998_c0_g1_i1.p2  ORF type:complete len:325 (+),score=64.81 TRINITY_DN16998_c0_g1_i1:136-1110(+)